MKLFEEYPTLSDDTVILDRITESDIPALEALTADELVARTIPTFLYEQKYDDKRLMLARMDEECFLTRQSLLLAVRPQTPERPLIGIAEIYNYEESKKKLLLVTAACATAGERAIPRMYSCCSETISSKTWV